MTRTPPTAPPTPSPPPAAGARQIGPYRVIRRLGAGGMGEVFLAERVGAGGFRRRCCVKTVLPQLAKRAQLLELFEREAVLAARVSHENVVQVFDYGETRGLDGDSLYLAMEYVDGISARVLTELAARSGAPMSVVEACAITADVARGLAAVHALVADDGAPVGLVHRDVSPDNILVTRDGLSKLGDFGVARAHDSEPMTATGDVRGKVPYLSPEQIDGQPTTQAADVFALGVTFFQLLAGQRPFDRGTELGTLTAIVSDPPPDLRTLRPETPDDVIALVEGLLDKTPSRRPTARAVVERLLAAVPAAAARPTALMARALAIQAADEAQRHASAADAGNRANHAHANVNAGHARAPAVRVADTTQLMSSRVERPRQGVLIGALVGTTVTLALVLGVIVVVLLSRDPALPAAAAVAPLAPSPAPRAAPEDAPSTAPDAEPDATPAPEPDAQPDASAARAPLVKLVGPPWVRWSAGGKALGAGTLEARVHKKLVTALDTSTGGKIGVTVKHNEARFDAVPKGTLEVRAEPYADVFLGTRALGTTPLKPRPELPAGEYRVRLRYEEQERTVPVVIRTGQNTVVRVDMTDTTNGAAP